MKLVTTKFKSGGLHEKHVIIFHFFERLIGLFQISVSLLHDLPCHKLVIGKAVRKSNRK